MEQSNSEILKAIKCRSRGCRKVATRVVTHPSIPNLRNSGCPIHLCESHSYRWLSYNLETNRMRMQVSCSQCMEPLDPLSYGFEWIQNPVISTPPPEKVGVASNEH